MHRLGLFEHVVPMRGKSSPGASAAGVASVAYGPVPQGYAWYVERISVHCPTANSVASVMASTQQLSAVDLGTRADFTTAGADSIADETNPIVLLPGYFLSIVWTGATAGDVCTAAIQYAVHQLDPHYLMSPEDQRQVLEAHEHLTAGLTHSAVAERRAV